MRSRDEAQATRAAAVRLRAAAPVAAFCFPALLLALAPIAGMVAGDGAASAFVAVAAPTATLVSMLFDDTPIAVLLAAMLLSGPLWGVLGRSIANRVPDGRWRAFWRMYALACGAWLVVSVMLLVIAD